MSQELFVPEYTPSLASGVVYANIWTLPPATIWNRVAVAFATYTAGNITQYNVDLAEVAAGSGYYRGDFPADITAPGDYIAIFRHKQGGTPAQTDPRIGGQVLHWSGTAIVPLATTATGAAVAAIATAVAAIAANVTTAVNRIGGFTGSGINTIFGFLRAFAAKASGLTPSDLASGTTFDNTTDSLEAIRDRGDTAWAGGGDSVTITPVAATVSTGEVTGPKITAYQNRAFAFTFALIDAAGEPVDVSGKTLHFTVRKLVRTGQLFQLTTASGITIGGANNNEVTVAGTDAHTATPDAYSYELVNHTDDKQLQAGSFEIEPTT